MRPEYSSSHAAGADLRANLSENLRIAPGERVLVPTGVRCAIPPGYEGQVRPRSGLAWKHGVTVANAPGTIDPDYRGEVKVILVNLGDDDFVIRRGDRIAQLVIAPTVTAEFEYQEELSESTRGGGGFGSTGV
jgi:dUTP pyrophosphatase